MSTSQERPQPELSVETRFSAAQRVAYRAAGAWRDDSFTGWLERWAAEVPDRRAVTDGVHDLSYGELRRQYLSLAQWLRRRGIGDGDRVAVQLPNWAEFVPVYAAVARVRAVLVPIMPIYRHDEVRHVLANSGARLAVTAGTFRGFDHLEMFRDLRSGSALDELVVVRASGELGADEVALVDVLVGEADDSGLGPHADPDLPHTIIYSSGTESSAKGCVHTWNTLSFTAWELGFNVFDLGADDTVFMPSPITHSTGLVEGVVAPILAGCGAHLQDVWDPDDAVRRIAQYRCTASATATSFVSMSIQASAGLDAGHHSGLGTMRTWLCAGSPIPETLAAEFAEAFPSGRLLPLYGATEVLAATVCRPGDELRRITGSDGSALHPLVELKLVDDDGETVPIDESGEVCYRGPGASLGYWADPERTRAAIDDEGWHHCGDLAVLDADGYLRITGRKKDIIIRGGQNLSAQEIELHVAAHPAVRQVAAVGYPDERLGERVCAFISLHPGEELDLPDLRDFLVVQRRVAVQKVPERLVLLDELPMTPTGKIQKFRLRDQERT